MEIRRFRETTGCKCHWAVMMGIGLIWAVLSLSDEGGEYEESADVSYEYEFDDHGEFEEEFSVGPAVDLRFVERELILLEAGEGRGWLIEWLTGQDDRETYFDQLSEILAGYQFDPQGMALQEIIESKKSDDGSSSPAFSDDEKEVMIHRFLLSESLWYFAIFGAVPAMWWARRDWRMPGKDWRMLGAWWPTTVLTIFFAASLIGEQLIFNLTYFELYRLAGDDWGLVWSSLVWRGSAAVLAAFILVGGWSGMSRVFIGRNPVDWKALAGVFCVLAAFEAIRVQGGVESEVIDPTDYFLVADPSRFELIFEFVDAAIFAPIFEELMFRGVLFLGLMRRMGALPAALLSSLLFAVVHTQYDAWELISVGVFGLACCWLTWRTGSIKSGIVLHMIYNALITAGVYLVYQMPL